MAQLFRSLYSRWKFELSSEFSAQVSHTMTIVSIRGMNLCMKNPCVCVCLSLIYIYINKKLHLLCL